MPAPGFLSDVVLWPWYLPAGEDRTVTLTFDEDPGTVTVDAGPAYTIPATIDGTGTTRTITWSAEQAVAIGDDGILGGKWRLRINGVTKMGGPIRASSPTLTPTAAEWTVQLPDVDGGNLTVTVIGGTGSGVSFAASVILHTDSLTPSNGDALYWVAYTPGHVDSGGPGGSQRVQNDWEVLEAYEWGDETWEPPAGGTDVLLLMGEDSWPTVFATASPDALTAQDVPGLSIVALGCGGSSGTTGTALWVARNFDGFEGAPSPDEPAYDFVPVVTLAQSVMTRAWTGRLAGLDQNVGAVLDMLDAGLDDHYVAMFVTGDDDFSGGTLTGITLHDTGDTVPREYVVTAPVCVVDGPDMGLWTITASGPCTAGRSIDPGDIIRAFAQGFIAVAGSSDGETVSGINVAATYETVRELGEAVADQATGITNLSGTVDGLVDEVGDLTPRVDDLAKNASEAATGLALTNHANGMGTVWAWAECGLGDIGFEAHVRGYWSCPVILPTPTTSLFTRALVRSISGSRDPALYQEICSEPMDSLGVPGDGGAWDHDEFAVLSRDGALSAFFEWTADGGTTEWHTDQDPVVDPPYGPGIPPGAWVEIAVAAPDFSTGILYLLARTDHGNYVDPWDEDRWRILCTYDTGAPITFEDSTAVEMWIGRGGGRIDIARVRRWIDDVLRSDFNPFMGGNGATTIADQVLVDEFDDPAIWTASDNAVNVNNA